MDQKSSFFICPRISARFLHCFCTVSRDAMGTLTCKIRQMVQKLPSRKSRCFAQKRRKLETSKIRVFCPVGSFNQRARDSSSLERTKIPRRIVRFLVGFSFCTPFARSLHGFHITAGDHQLVGGAGMPQTVEHDLLKLRVLCTPSAVPFIAIFKNSAYQNGIFAICSLRMLLVH